MFIRITACLLADPLDGPFAPGCFRHFIASVPAPAATGWSESCRVGYFPPLEFRAFPRRTQTGSKSSTDHPFTTQISVIEGPGQGRHDQ